MTVDVVAKSVERRRRAAGPVVIALDEDAYARQHGNARNEKKPAHRRRIVPRPFEMVKARPWRAEFPLPTAFPSVEARRGASG